MFQIITDSACDLTPEQAAALGVQIIPFYASTDGETYQKEGVELPIRELYRFMVENPDKIFEIDDRIYLISRGNYKDIPWALQLINPKNNTSETILNDVSKITEGINGNREHALNF